MPKLEIPPCRPAFTNRCREQPLRRPTWEFQGLSLRFAPRPAILVQSNFMPKLGFLGLGLMGYPMARNLLRAGHEVAVWSNTSAKAQKLANTEKGKFCATPKEVAENADVVFLCVGDTAMAKDVILGPRSEERRVGKECR